MMGTFSGLTVLDISCIVASHIPIGVNQTHDIPIGVNQTHDIPIGVNQTRGDL